MCIWYNFINIFTEKKCFECPICKEEFGQVFGLKEHVKVHSTGGRFTCPHCNKVIVYLLVE